MNHPKSQPYGLPTLSQVRPVRKILVLFIPSELGKFCRVCGYWYPFGALVKNTRNSHDVETICYDCNSERGRRWKEANRERNRQRDREYEASRRPRKNKQATKRYHANLERARSKQREYRKRANGKIRATKLRRRARLFNLPDDFSADNWNVCLEYWHNCCAYCGHQQGLFFDTRLTADHLVPVSHPDCPGSTLSNIVPACHSCNASKGPRELGKWLCQSHGKTEAKRILKRIAEYTEWVKHRPSED